MLETSTVNEDINFVFVAYELGYQSLKIGTCCKITFVDVEFPAERTDFSLNRVDFGGLGVSSKEDNVASSAGSEIILAYSQRQK